MSRAPFLTRFRDYAFQGAAMNIAVRPPAVVTGASSVIGLGLARQRADDGFDVVITSRSSNVIGRIYLIHSARKS
jgi:hypothetical protein